MDLRVTASANGFVMDWGQGPRRCALGPAGIGIKGGEGDGVTPRGRFPIREVFYRADRMDAPATLLPLWSIARDDGWCDAPEDSSYNRLVKLPYPASAEAMWREDGLYDLVAVIGYNDDPVMSGMGSAIFLHIAKPEYAPTAGCVALARDDVLAALEQFAPGDAIVID